MSTRIRGFIGLIGVFWLVAGCDDPLDLESSWFRAVISEHLVDGSDAPVIYEGQAIFNHGVIEGPIFPSGRKWFSVASLSPETGGADERFLLYRLGGGTPAVGEYALGPVNQNNPAAEGFALFYEWVQEGGGEGAGRTLMAAAVSGTLRISATSSRLVRGTFDAIVAEYCRVGDGWSTELLPCIEPWLVDESRPQMTVSGEFIAAYDDQPVSPLPAPPITP